MTGLHDAFAAWAAWAVPAVANHLWQATLFALVVAGAAALLGRAPARARTAVWVAASAKFALPLALFTALGAAAGLDLAEPAAPGAPPSEPAFVWTLVEPVGAPAPAPVASPAGHDETYCVLAAVWAAGFATALALWWSRHRRIARMVYAGRRLVSGREVALLERACERLGLKTVVRLVESPEADEPGVWRVWHPVLVLPEGVGDHLDDDELEAVMMHEAAHVARRDNLVANLQMALCCALWFHPVVWFVDRRLLAERERACDEAVIGAGGGAREYARGLLKVFRYSIGWRTAGVSCATGSHLGRRIDQIMNGNIGISMTWHRAVTAAVVVGLAGLSAVAMTFGVAGDDGQKRQIVVRQHQPKEFEARLLEAAQSAATVRSVDVANTPASPVALLGVEVKKVPASVLDGPADAAAPRRQEVVRRNEGGEARPGGELRMKRFPETDADGNTTVLLVTISNTSAQTVEAAQIGGEIAGGDRNEKFRFAFHRTMEPGTTMQVAVPVGSEFAAAEGFVVSLRGGKYADGTTFGDFQIRERVDILHPAH